MIALFLTPVYILINLYVLRWMFHWMGSCHYLFQTLAFRIIYAGVYTVLASALLTGFLTKRLPFLHRILKVISNYFLGTFEYIVLMIATFDLGRLFLKYVLHISWTSSTTAFAVTGGICTVLIISLSIYGIFHAGNIKTTSYQVSIDKQVPEIESLKIILMADVHLGYSVGEKQAENIVKKINSENPDFVCIAGDIFDNEFDSIQYPEKIKKRLKSIHTKYGVYACWGNHDLDEPILAGFTFKGGKQAKNDPHMEEFLKDCSIHLLKDEAILIDNKFYIVGRNDEERSEKLGITRKTPAELTKSLDKTKPIIFMDHQPKELQETADAGADLDLCGHTHNGQMFPGNLLIHLLWENPCGYLKKGSMHNIVTSGAGIWGPGMRVGTDSEICSITVNFVK